MFERIADDEVMIIRKRAGDVRSYESACSSDEDKTFRHAGAELPLTASRKC
jgi:hypothetical protein